MCVSMQEELRSTQTVGDKEVRKLRAMERVKIREPANRKRIVSYNHYLYNAGIPEPLIFKAGLRKGSQVSSRTCIYACLTSQACGNLMGEVHVVPCSTYMCVFYCHYIFVAVSTIDGEVVNSC